MRTRAGRNLCATRGIVVVVAMIGRPTEVFYQPYSHMNLDPSTMLADMKERRPLSNILPTELKNMPQLNLDILKQTSGIQ
jgi:hypothetical protein